LVESTSIRVSKDNARRLAALQRGLNAKSMDETIGILVKRRRKKLLNAAFGSDRVRSRKFKDEDRLEGRS
jgi:hypothetical protein